MPYDQDIALSSLPMLQNSGIYCLKYLYVSDVVVTGLATAPTVENENGNIGNLHGGRLLL